MPYFILMEGNLTLLESELEHTPLFRNAVEKAVKEISKGRAELVFYAGQVKR